MSRLFVLVVMGLLWTVAGCSSPPREIARSESISNFGLAYRGQVVGVRPIFVAEETGLDEYEDAASASGIALGSIIFASSSVSSALSDALSATMAAISGEIESNHRADYCQIYVSVENATLIQSVLDDTTAGAGESMLELLFDRKEDLRDDLNQIGDQSSQEADSIRAKIEELNSIIDKRISEKGISGETQMSILGIVSPCWELERGSSVYLTKFSDGIAVQPIR